MNKDELGSGKERMLRSKIKYTYKQIKTLKDTGGDSDKIVKLEENIKLYELELSNL